MSDCKLICVSVIVAIYNSEKWIRKCIDSLLVQTLKEFELILVDDGSIDSSSKICDDYSKKDSRVRVLHKPNGGVASAREAGISMARGEYTIHADPDDWCEPDMLKELYELAVKENADIVSCDFYGEYSHTEKKYRSLRPKSLTTNEYFHEILNGLHGSLCTRLIKRQILVDNNIHFPMGMNYSEDKYVLLWAISVSNRYSHLDKAFYHYMINMPTSLTNAYYPNNLLGMAITFRNHCLNEYPKPYNEIAALGREKGFFRKALIEGDKVVLKEFRKNFSLLKKNFLSSNLLLTNKFLLFIAYYISPYLAHIMITLRMKLS